MTLEREAALEMVLERGDEWRCWRALRLDGDQSVEMPQHPEQQDTGAFLGESGRTSAGTTGLELCHLVAIGLADSGAAAIAGDWLEEARTPSGAWLDSPDDVPGRPEVAAAGRVWATASAACALMAVGREPGTMAFTLLRNEADGEGRFSGGAYPTFAAAGAYWLAEGPKTEMAEWALRWTREWDEDWWGPWEWVTALTFWSAARIPAEHRSVESFLDRLLDAAPPSGWLDDVELTLRTLEIATALGA